MEGDISFHWANLKMAYVTPLSHEMMSRNTLMWVCAIYRCVGTVTKTMVSPVGGMFH